MAKYVVHYELYPHLFNQQIVTAQTIQEAMRALEDTGRRVTGAESYNEGDQRRLVDPGKAGK